MIPTSVVVVDEGALSAGVESGAGGGVVVVVVSGGRGVCMTVVKLVPGRKRGGKCQAPSRRNRKGKPCKREVAIGSFTRSSTAGVNRFRFTGRIGGHKLPVGNYKLVLQATDAAGNHSIKSKRPFRIVK